MKRCLMCKYSKICEYVHTYMSVEYYIKFWRVWSLICAKNTAIAVSFSSTFGLSWHPLTLLTPPSWPLHSFTAVCQKYSYRCKLLAPHLVIRSPYFRLCPDLCIRIFATVACIHDQSSAAHCIQSSAHRTSTSDLTSAFIFAHRIHIPIFATIACIQSSAHHICVWPDICIRLCSPQSAFQYSLL